MELADAALGKVHCQQLTLQQVAGKMQLVGPGRVELTQAAEHNPNQPAGQIIAKGPAIATWSKSLDLEFQSVPDPKNPCQRKSRPFAMRSSLEVRMLQDPETSRIKCELLDVLFARAA